MARVLMFGALAEAAGWRARDIEVGSLDGLRTLLAAEDGRLGERLSGPGVCAVLNTEMVRGDRPLKADDEVAFIPPVSGG
ncbi:MoaD/ThiS family protein [Brevundimonas sp.]|uniref:MoaD/ThiS family protein n=1 Tax=Brevundimonas sp. TaxID=1871086 RepID=UPI001A1839C2|nr:MoaD/ThiS family protein [Brevundimonas sp.]MBJ7486356.1 MoaD/ThiS family protein [Brevundimonas sp.]